MLIDTSLNSASITLHGFKRLVFPFAIIIFPTR